jgi:hypothetical protein
MRGAHYPSLAALHGGGAADLEEVVEEASFFAF